MTLSQIGVVSQEESDSRDMNSKYISFRACYSVIKFQKISVMGD